jgi:outer membrane protein OmpA-like peptidoglycan-associated protein
MADEVVNTYSEALFDLYSRLNVPSKKGSQNGWPYYQTEAGLRIFQEAAEPHVSGTAQPATLASHQAAAPGPQTRPNWLRTFWPVLVGACVVICCVLALAWEAHKQAQTSTRLQHQDTEIAAMWRETEQKLMQSLLAEVGGLNTNQAALAANQAQIGVGFAQLSIIDTQLAALVSSQADASRGLAAAQSALAQQVTNLATSLPQSFQQGLAEAASQSRADIVELQKQLAELVASLRQTSTKQEVAEAARQSRAETVKLQTQVAELESSLRQSFHQGLAEVVGKSRADTEKLQTRVAEVAASHRALLDRLSGPTSVPKLALALPGVRTMTLSNSILLTFDDGLFLHGTDFKPDAKSRLQVVAKALAQCSPPLRVEVIGCADEDRALESSPQRLEESLALDRAAAVVNYFIELGVFAPNRLAALGSVGTSRPFPCDTVLNRTNNRTIALRVSTEGWLAEGVR